MNNSKVALLLIGCAVATLQPGAALSEIFPLKHGIYVLSNVPCGDKRRSETLTHMTAKELQSDTPDVR
jgi:hypothetical protein